LSSRFPHRQLNVGCEAVKAILEWKFCRLGDPYADIGWFAARLGALRGSIARLAGLPTGPSYRGY
jgi:aminoglycoside phosphotransferase (APT) family kinase protein